MIRPWKLSDAPKLTEAVLESVEDLYPWMPWCSRDYHENEAVDFIQKSINGHAEATGFEFMITDSSDECFGACGINGINPTNKFANLGYWIRTSMTGRGLATMAVSDLRDWGFKNTDLIRLEIVIAKGNLGSHRVAEKAGSKREGVLGKRLLLYDVPHDATLYAFTRQA